MISLPKEKKIEIIGVFFLLIISFVILSWSLITAGFERMMSDLKINNLRKIPIEYVKELDNGEKISRNYKVPESNIEPGDVIYPFKKIRDNLWILLAKTPKQKAEVYLLMADKRLFEATQLVKNQKSDDLILKTFNNSIYNLMEAKKNLFNESKKDPEFFRINQQINQSGLAYEDIIKSLNYKNEEMEKIINKLENWNQKNEKELEKN